MIKAHPRTGPPDNPSWWDDPMTSAQQWRLQKERDTLGMPTLSDIQMKGMTKKKAHDMLEELLALRDLQDEEFEERANAFTGELDGYSGDEPPWI